MKNLRFIYLLAFLGISWLGNECYSQMTFSFPPFYSNTVNVLNLPQPSGQDPYYAYHGQSAIYNHNIFTTSSGELLFFIVDQFVYDNEGYLINDLMAYPQGVKIAGNCESIIVPIEGECKRFMIISSGLRGDTRYPYYAILDLNATNEFFPDRKGALENLFNGYTQAVPIQNFTPNFRSDDKQELVQLAMSNSKQDGSRDLYISNGFGIYRTTLNGDVFQNSNSLFLPFPMASFNQISMRGELEIYEYDDGTTRLSCNYGYETPNLTEAGDAVFTVLLDQNGNEVQGTHNIALFKKSLNQSGNSESARIHGLEYSEDGNILYITHQSNTANPHPINYIDFNNPNGINYISLPNESDFQKSQIERTEGGELILVSSDRIAKLSNVNNPLNVNFQDNLIVFPSSYNPSDMSYMGNDVISFTISEGYTQKELKTEFFEGVCCLEYSSYETDDFLLTNNQDWSPGSCSLDQNNDGVLEVRDEFRISAGRVLRLWGGMKIAFAPNAKLVIEEGAKLILDNATLTIDERCVEGELWKGVEVHGIKTAPQGQLNGSFSANNSLQGHLFMTNDSKIEHAEVAVLLGARNSDDIIVTSLKTGGVFQARNSTLENNMIGVQANPYTTEKSLSWMRYSTLRWTDDNHFTNLPLYSGTYLAWLNGHDGFMFGACHFDNATTNPNQKGNGIGVIGTNSTFAVVGQATCQSLPCATYDRGDFVNLGKGVFVINGSSSQVPFRVSHTDFVNCKYGVDANNTMSAKLVFNEFKTFESATFRTAGLVMRNCSGYIVEENVFGNLDNPSVALSDVQSYGIVVSNSGPSNNQIYRNTFKNLKIGGQSELDNGPRTKSQGSWDDNGNNIYDGLVWKCNTFESNSISKHDLIVVNGDIARDQGVNAFFPTDNERRKMAANNRFSLINESMSLEHDFSLDINSASVEYHHLHDAIMTPDSRTTGLPFLNPNPIEAFDGSGLYSNGQECPSNQNGLIVLGPELVESQIDELRAANIRLLGSIDGGETDYLIETISRSAVIGDIVSTLLSRAPLSDKVLIAFLKSNPPASAVKTILLASSGLSEEVLAEYEKLNLPLGVRNEIDLAQGLLSERTKLEIAHHVNEVTIDYLFNELIQSYFFDSEGPSPYEDVISTLNDYNTLINSDIIESYVVNLMSRAGYDASRVSDRYNTLMSSAQLSAAYKDMFALDIATNNLGGDAALVLQTPANMKAASTLANLDDLATESHIDARAIAGANSLLFTVDLNDLPVEILLPAFAGKSGLVDQEEAKVQVKQIEYAVIYPNPSTGVVNIDFTTEQDGDMTIEVLDIQGRLVHQSSREKANSEQLDLSNLNNGMYLIRVSINNKVIAIERWQKQ